MADFIIRQPLLIERLERLNDAQLDRERSRVLEQLKREPRSIELWHELGEVFLVQENYQGLQQVCAQAMGVEKLDPAIWWLQARCLLWIGQKEAAQKCMQMLLRLAPKSKALIQKEAQRLASAEWGPLSQLIYQVLIEAAPDEFGLRVELGELLCQLGGYEKAIVHLKHAAALQPSNHSLLFLLANTLLEARKFQEAEARFLASLRLQPDHLDSVAGLSLCADRQGDPERAWTIIEPYIDQIEGSPQLLFCYATLCDRLGRYREAVIPLERTLAKPHSGTVGVFLGHALGRLKERLGDTAGAFQAHDQANQLRTVSFHPGRHLEYVEELIRVFSREAMTRLPRATTLDGRAVFIVGMPRSGTSLTEQILTSHPRVKGGGERQALLRMASSCPGGSVLGAVQLSAQAVQGLSAGFYNEVGLLAPGAQIFTDKHPLNFFNLGLIERVCPGAKIIHCQRAPLDTALSCYFQNFDDQYAFTTRLEWLGHYYVGYERLMAHWSKVSSLPMFSLNYEDLVSDSEATIRALLEFCGLPWDERCLAPHENKRVVDTASYAQVQSPIHQGSVGKAKSYQVQLQPLVKILRGA